ncbi:hypothetical protein R1sor_019143 [Riccia sorocarpa]|uniref:Uncharacterized protein n=1 Tax=Riccia sorocarpa TaxID=122646 RepID=A0ABD3IC99_9MARC
MSGPQEELLTSAMERISLQNRPRRQEPEIRVAVSGKEGLKGIKKLIEKGIYTYYFEGEPLIAAFRSWVMTNWGRRLNIQIDAILEATDRAILTIGATSTEPGRKPKTRTQTSKPRRLKEKNGGKKTGDSGGGDDLQGDFQRLTNMATKKRRFLTEDRETHSEPTLELQLATPEGLRASRSG